MVRQKDLIIRQWLGRKISFWKHINGEIKSCQLQHCLSCSNGGMSIEEKERLKEEFIDEDKMDEQPQRLFHINGLPTQKELFEFIALMRRRSDNSKMKVRKGDKHRSLLNKHKDLEEIVFGENENNTPNRVIVMDDLMNDAFNPKDKEVKSTMSLLMTKLSHHNNISVLIVCHELYPKGPNSVVLREQLTGILISTLQK